MKPELIAQSHLLDIVFNGRNKEYGAYNLRKFYHQRLAKALAVTFTVVLLFAFSWYINALFVKGKNSEVNTIPVTDVELEKIEETKTERKKEEPKALKSKPKATINAAPPVIVPDKLVEKDIPTVAELNSQVIGHANLDGDSSAPTQVNITAQQGEANIGVTPAKQPEPEETGPLNFAEIMPEFPGGMAAFKRFMQNHLRIPDELNEGEKVIVKAKFVVDKDGSISGIDILQSAGDLDKEVLRVIHKMPRWKPGMQNGRTVSVYFILPVTFLGPEN